MNAIEIRDLTKNFGDKQAVKGLNMTVPVGSIYGFIGENGSGKSTTEKMICGLIRKSGGTITLFGKDYEEEEVRSQIGVLIEEAGCFPNLTVWNNLMIQAVNLGIKDAEKEVRESLKLVRMEGAAGNKFKNCSLGMKQRVGIAMALLGSPRLLILDEPINGLDADGMRIVREVLLDITKKGATVLISSHVLGELQKVATRYGIIRGGKMIKEMTAEELDANCRTFVKLSVREKDRAKELLLTKYRRVLEDGSGYLRVYDAEKTEEVVSFLFKDGIVVSEICRDKIGLEEYYTDLMDEKGEN